MYLRRRDRKKIAKFDPSKTTHCLKKIKPEEPNIAVSELTWNLESEGEKASGTPGKILQMKRKKREKSKLKVVESTKTDFDVSNGLEKYGKRASADTLTGDFVPLPSASHSKELSADGYSDLDSDSTTSHSGSDTGLTCKRNTLCNTVGNTSNKTDSSTSSVSPSPDALPVSTPSKKKSVSVEKKKTHVLSIKSEVESAPCMKIQNEGNILKDSLGSPNIGRVKLENDTNLSDENNSIASDRKSSDSESEIVIKGSRDQPSREIDTKLDEISVDLSGNSSNGLQVRFPKSKVESQVTENPHKQRHSNEKRLDALKDKKKSVLAQKNLIKDALKDLDSGTQSHDGKKHIVFSDNDDDVSGDDVKEKAAYSIGDKVRIF